MIITKEFLDKLLDTENMQRYRSGRSFLNLPDQVVSFAYTLEGLDHLAALDKVSGKMKQEEKVSFSNRNQYVELYRALRSEVDYGFTVGEIVSYWCSPRITRSGPILKIENGQAIFADRVVPMTWVSEYVEVKEPEQTKLDL